jgi:hypothetical protein
MAYPKSERRFTMSTKINEKGVIGRAVDHVKEKTIETYHSSKGEFGAYKRQGKERYAEAKTNRPDIKE